MNALDTMLNVLTSKLEILKQEEEALKQKQVALGKEIAQFFTDHDTPPNAHPLEIIKHFRRRKVIETL